MKNLCKNSIKHVMAYLLALFLILSLGTVNIGRLSAAETVDGGEAESVYAGGNGTAESPYLVSTAAALRAAAEATNNKDVYYKLTNDIYVNGDANTDWDAFWSGNDAKNNWFARWGLDEANQFNGNFDGCGYTVYGLYLSYDTENVGGARMGLFPVIGAYAVIKSVKISQAVFCSDYSAGSLVGETHMNVDDLHQLSEISGCYADETVDLKARLFAGGIIGAGNPPIINNCGFTGKLEVKAADGKVAGIMGHDWDIKNSEGIAVDNGCINNCYTVGYEICGNMGQFWRSTGTLENLYSTIDCSNATKLTPDQMKGTDAIANMAFDRLDWDFCYNGYPVPAVRADGYAAGDGKENNPYIIKNEAQLKLLVTDTDTAGKYYKLADNIVVNKSLEGTPKLWFNVTGDDATDIKFEGTLDGDGYTVSGLYFRGFGWGYYGTGIIPRADGATVKNIGLVNSDFAITGGNDANMVGSIIGRGNNVNISGCFADETVSLNSNSGLAGGIIAVMTGASNIENCCFTGKLAGSKTDAFFADGWDDWKNIKFSYTTSPLSTRNDTNYSAVYTTDTASVNGKNIFEVDPTNLVGAKAVAGLQQLDFGNTHIWRITDGYPTLTKHYQAQRRAAGLWDGSAASSYDSGDGTADNPHKIATAEQLRKLVTDTATEGKYYVLTSDIKLNDTAAEGWTTSLLSNNWVTLYNGDIQFKGNFNGGGHNISGMLYNASNTTDGHRSGLFPVVGAGAVITNFSVSDFDMSVGCYGGAAAGYVEANSTETFPEFSYIDVRNTVNIKGTFAGGVAGAGGYANFDNCCVTANISLRDQESIGNYVGGISGGLWGDGTEGVYYNITNSYTASYAPYNINYGLAKVTNVYAASHGTQEIVPSVVNKDAMNCLPNLNWKDVWAWDGEGTPYLKLNESGVYGTYMLGDTNCDGTVGNSLDITVMRKHLLGATEDGVKVFAYNADINEDGTVNILDLVRLKKSSPVA